MLVDDSKDDNFIHQRVLVKSELVANENIFIKENGEEAYDFLVDTQNTEKYQGIFPPQLILLDISMPCMDGFEFLEEYQKVKEQFDLVVIVMLTTSINSQDKERAKKFSQVVGYVEKPLTKEKIYDIHEQYFGK